MLTRNLTLITATARTPVCLLILSMPKFESIVKQEPAHFQAFAALQSDRYALILQHVAQCTGLPSEEYLRVRLADISDMIHLEGGVNGVVELALSQIDLARMIGVSRQTVNALLKKLENEGLIDVSFRKIHILDPQGLRSSRRKKGP